MRRAAVCLIESPAGKRMLVVWNKRYGGWSLPGGKVEDGESPADAAARELEEETGLEVIPPIEQVFEGEHGMKVESTRGSVVHVFRVRWWKGVPREVEAGCPITWLTREEFMEWSPFAEFYRRVFEAIG